MAEDRRMALVRELNRRRGSEGTVERVGALEDEKGKEKGKGKEREQVSRARGSGSKVKSAELVPEDPEDEDPARLAKSRGKLPARQETRQLEVSVFFLFCYPGRGT